MGKQWGQASPWGRDLGTRLILRPTLTCLKVGQFPSHWLISQLLFFLSLHQRTPLHLAAKEGHKETVVLLIQEGAKISIQDNDGVGVCDYTTDDILSLNLSCIAPLQGT